jgi:hypothetical protein
MAELLIGPLVSLAVYLGTWIRKRRKQREINREIFSEATALVNSVNSLAYLVQGKVDALQKFVHRNGFPSNSFGLSSLVKGLIGRRIDRGDLEKSL